MQNKKIYFYKKYERGMIMANNLKALKIDGIEYTWDFMKSKSVLEEFAKDHNRKKNTIYEEISKLCVVTDGAVKNWFVRKNGPGDEEYVRKMAAYFGTDYRDLLKVLRSDKEEFMEELFEHMLLENDTMNRTIKLIGYLNQLAADTAKGFMGFDEFVGHHKYHGDTVQELLDYEYTGGFYPGIIYVDDDSPDHGKIVADMCVDFQHSDVVSTYDSVLNHYCGVDYKLIVRDEDPDNIFIELSGDDLCIVIENGRWYSC